MHTLRQFQRASATSQPELYTRDFSRAGARIKSFCRAWLPITVTILCFHFFASSGFSTDERTQAETHVDLGLQFAQQGDLVHAESELRQAAEIAPTDPEILASFGTVLAMQNKLEESSSVFQRELKVSPRDITVRRYLAANLWQLHRYAESKQNLQVLLSEKPDDQPARLLLGMVSENMKDYATAAKMLSSVPEQVRQQPQSIEALARSYYHLGQTSKARPRSRNYLILPRKDRRHFRARKLPTRCAITRQRRRCCFQLNQYSPTTQLWIIAWPRFSIMQDDSATVSALSSDSSKREIQAGKFITY